MGIERHFLGEPGPFLPRVAEFLGQRFTAGRALDLTNLLLVTPSGRSNRRLLELLIEQCSGRDGQPPRLLSPPEIITAGQLPERLYRSDPGEQPLDGLRALLLRVQTLREAAPETLARVVRHPPDPDDLPGWSALATRFEQLALDLARFDLTVGDLPKRVQGAPGTTERLAALAALEAGYRKALGDLGAVDIVEARFRALRERRCFAEKHLVLVAVSDLGSNLAAMLRQAARAEPAAAEITVVVQAAPEHAEGFDELGGFRVDYWARQQVPLQDRQINVVERSTDQPARVVELIAEANRNLQWAADQISVGVGDEEGSALPVRRALELFGAASHRAAGEPVALSGPALLLEALAEFSRGGRQAALAELLRHPDLDHALQPSTPAGGTNPDAARIRKRGRADDRITLLDRYQADHLQERLGESWLGDLDRARGESQVPEKLRELFEQVWGLLPAEPCQQRPIYAWVEPLTRVLAEVYAERVLDSFQPDDARLIECLKKLRQALDELGALKGAYDPSLPRVDFAGAVGFLLQLLKGERIRELSTGPAVELLGFLELALDDAPLLIITDMNEALVPTSRRADPFLPDSVRTRLGLEDDRRRYARDLLRLVAVLQGHQQVRIIVPRRDRDHNPLSPSRLLLSCDDRTLLRRVRDFYDERRATRAPRLLLEPGREDLFDIPYPEPPKTPLDRLSVSAFNDYLGCPYRFYLKRICRLESIDDRFRELQASHFGNLAHAVLESFGRQGPIGSSEAGPIAEFLFEQLDAQARRVFGPVRRAAIELQLRRLRMRFERFASDQAEQSRQGWRIERDLIEARFERWLEVDGERFTIHGKIDRIDRHPEQGYRILDYKTSESGKAPDLCYDATVEQGFGWNDLQLPLYRFIVEAHQVTGPVQLGYFNLPADTEDAQAGVRIASWDAEALARADRERDAIIRAIRQSVYWPPNPPPSWPDGLEGICADGVAGRENKIAAAGARARVMR